MARRAARAGFLLAPLLFCVAPRARAAAPENDPALSAAVARFRRSSADFDAFTREKSKLQDELLRRRQEGVLPSTAPLNSAADAILDVYAARRRKGADDSDDPFPVFVAARYANDRKAGAFLESLLAGPPGRLRQAAVEELVFSGTWSGDARLFAALEKLEREERGRSVMPLAAMRNLDPARALPAIARVVETTDSPVMFYKAAGLLSSYGRAELMEPAYRRAPELARSKGDFKPGLLDATDPELLLETLRRAKGRAHQNAVAALAECGKARAKASR